jgi:hypothetical protein
MTAEQAKRLEVIKEALMTQQAQLEAFTVDCPEALAAFEALDTCTDEIYDLLDGQCDECGGPNPDGGDGYDGKCPECADRAEREVTPCPSK